MAMGLEDKDRVELQIVGCEVLQEQRSQVVGGSPVFMKQ